MARSILRNLLMSAIAALLLGTVLGPYLYFNGSCWSPTQDCAAHSPTQIGLAYFLSAPLFLLHKVFFGTTDRISNFDPVVFGKFGWLAIWLYYYVLVWLITALIQRMRRVATNRGSPL